MAKKPKDKNKKKGKDEKPEEEEEEPEINVDTEQTNIDETGEEKDAPVVEDTQDIQEKEEEKRDEIVEKLVDIIVEVVDNENNEIEEVVEEIPPEPEIEESIFLTESEANLKFLLMDMGEQTSHTSVEALTQPIGVICTVHLADSKGDLRTHPFYYLQYVKDPGIYRALHGPDPVLVYKADGQDKYKFMCEVMNSCYIDKFHKELLTDTIDLKYFGVNSSWLRAMCEALWDNQTVKVFNLARNVLTTDACYHIGELMMKNKCISEMNLMGCQIGMEGMRRLTMSLAESKKIKRLYLGHNNLKDEGLRVFAPVLKNPFIEELDLSYNKLNSVSGHIFAKNFKPSTVRLTELDISWNFLKNSGIRPILKTLRKATNLTSLNISWNNIESNDEDGDLIGRLMKSCRKLQFLDISHNLLEDTVVYISTYFPYVPNVQHMKIGCNRISPLAANMIMENFLDWRNKMKILDMECTNVFPAFVEMVNQIKSERARKNTEVIYETILNNYVIKGPSPKEVMFKRANFLAAKKKKSFGSFILRCQISVQGFPYINENLFASAMKKEKLGLDKDLLQALTKPFFNKKKGINIKKMADLVMEIWPETTPLDDVPPKRESVEKPKKQKKEKKGKSGKGKKKK